MTRIDPDDPKWTAYVLGELDDAARTAVEVELNASEDARGLVEELRVAAAMIKTELSTTAIPVQRLTNQQRQAIQVAAASTRPRDLFKPWFQPRRIGWITALAAAGVAAAVIVVTVRPRPREQAMQNAEMALPPAPAGTAPPPAAGDAETVAKKVLSAAAMRQDNQSVARSARAGKLFGTVQDATTAKIPGAAVVATNTDTGNAKSTVTNNSGTYTLDNLEPGHYQVSAFLPGFQTSTDGNIQLDQNGEKQKDLTLQVAAMADAVEVKPASPPNTAVTSRAGVMGGVASAAAPATDAVVELEKNEKASAGAFSPAPALRAQRLAGFARNAANSSSYSNIRGYLTRNQLPPASSIHIDDVVNHFFYDNPQMTGNDPISTLVEAAPAPWNVQHRLVRIAIRAREAANVTVQVEFNPTEVADYDVIAKNPGESGLNFSAGQNLTILYEILPSAKNAGTQMLTVKVRYLARSKQLESLVVPFTDRGQAFEASSVDFRFAAAVASFGLILTDSPAKGTATLETVRGIAENSLGADRDGSRHEFVDLVRRAIQLRP